MGFLPSFAFIALLLAFSGCNKEKKADAAWFASLPATVAAVSTCPPGGNCATTALGRKFPFATTAILIFQNEYSPAFLVRSAPPDAAPKKMYRDRPYSSLPNPLKTKTGTPADQEGWASFALPNGFAVTGGEAAVMDAIDVAAGAKPSLIAGRPELRPLLERFGHDGSSVEYNFTAQGQQQGIEGGLDAILGSWPVRTVLGPVTSYRGRASRFEEDGARCRLHYGIQLSSGVAARLLSGGMFSALSAGTFAGWPLGPEYLSKWSTRRDGELVGATLDLTKAGCEYWRQNK